MTAIVSGTRYEVTRLEVGPNSRAYGVIGNYSFEGPRGALYLVTEYADGLNSVSMRGLHKLPGLTRAHLAQLEG